MWIEKGNFRSSLTSQKLYSQTIKKSTIRFKPISAIPASKTMFHSPKSNNSISATRTCTRPYTQGRCIMHYQASNVILYPKKQLPKELTFLIALDTNPYSFIDTGELLKESNDIAFI